MSEQQQTSGPIRLPVQQSTANQAKIWKWTKKKELAVKLLAEDELPDRVIAERVGVSPRGLSKWKVHPLFEQRRRSIVETYRQRIMSSRYAVRENRVKLHCDLIDDKLQLKQERGERAEMQDPKRVPGGRTGLVTLEAKILGGDKIVEQFFDGALDSSIRASLNAIAEEVKPLGETAGRDRIDEFIDALREPHGDAVA